MQLTDKQKKVLAAIRKGIEGALEGKGEDVRDSVLVANKAVDILLLCDIADEQVPA